jgi:aldehyde:ferredoxin oxidoreductase
MTMTYYSSKRDQIENGYDPDATIRDAVLNTTITRKNLDEQAERLWQNYVEVNAEDGMTEESADLSPDDFRDYILSLFDEYGY